jgi:hypothetical protein
MRKLLIVSALLLGACTTFSDIEQGLGSLEGRKIESAFSALGYPDATLQVGRDTAYVWGNRQSFNLAVPTSQTTYGNVAGTPFSATTYGTSYQQVNYQCDIKIVASPSGVIKAWDYFGNIGGCARYATQLRKVAGEKANAQAAASKRATAASTTAKPASTSEDQTSNQRPTHQ